MTRYDREDVLTLADVPEEYLVNGFSTILNLSAKDRQVWTKAAISKETGVLFRPCENQKPLDKSWVIEGPASEQE